MTRRPRSRRAKSPEGTEGGGARRWSEARSVGTGARSRPHPAEPLAGAPKAQVPRSARSDVLLPGQVLPQVVDLLDFDRIGELSGHGELAPRVHRLTLHPRRPDRQDDPDPEPA